MQHAYRFGIEEEYFLADAATRGTPRRTIKAFHAALRQRLPQVERELLQSQVEVATPPLTDFAEAGGLLRAQRRDIAALGREHGLLLLAAGTHPLARWTRQSHTEAARYEDLMRDLRILGRRNLVCGMHVHVEVPEPEARIGLMRRLIPHLPLLLALSASSPFWQGRATGLAAYRPSVFGDLPRTGLPDLFDDLADYQRYVEIMTRAGAIRDASYLWWMLRPSVKFPTLELRVADCCTRPRDSLAIAALFRCLVRHVARRPDTGPALTGAGRALVAENLWRAQRDGLRAAMILPESGAVLPFAEHLEQLLALLAEDAAALGCEAALAGSRAILAEGSSADGQLAAHDAARAAGLETRAAIGAAVDWIARETAT